MQVLIDKKISKTYIQFQIGILVKRIVLYIFGFSFGYEYDHTVFSEKKKFYFRIYLPTLLKKGSLANYIGI